ncbi:hypothetical protein IKS86_01290 [bacterium]|nr:hypothetical protein [bacterium]
MTILDEKLRIMKDFDTFVKKYNDAVEIYNSKLGTIISGDNAIQLGDEEKPLIEGTYSFNEDGTIDIDGDFTMHEIYDLDVDTKTCKEDPVFVIDDFPFKFNRVSGDFEIFSTSIKDLDMFPRLVEGVVSICSNYDLRSVKGVAGSIVKGECVIETKAETIYFPDSVGKDLCISDRAWKVICLNKIVHVGGRFSFFKICSTDPQTLEIKEKVRAKEYNFNEDLGENVY